MRQKKILLIDDIQSVRETLRSYLCPPASAADLMTQLIQSGTLDLSPKFQIDEAGQGEEGVEKARKAFESGHPYDIAIIDMLMPPGIDGKETIRRIREFDTGLHIVVCTALSEASAEDLAPLNGGLSPTMIYKPLESAEYLRTIVNSAERNAVEQVA